MTTTGGLHSPRTPHDRGPSPTIWPVALATGVTFLAAGLITSPLLIVFGGLLMLASLAGWVSILLREGHEP